MAGPAVTPGPVQTKSQSLASAGSSLAVTMAAPITTGSTVVLALALSTSGSWIDHITDPNGNTYTLQASAPLLNGAGLVPAGQVHLYTAPNIIGGHSTYSIYLSGGTAIIISLTREVSGVIAKSFDKSVQTILNQSSQPFLSSPITAAQPNTLAIGWLGSKGTTAGTASGSFIHSNTVVSLGGSVSLGLEDLLVTDPQSLTSNWNLTGTLNIVTGLLFLKGPFDDESLNLGVLGCG